MNKSEPENFELNKLINEFKFHVSKDKPTDLISFAASYFTNLVNNANEEKYSDDDDDSYTEDSEDQFSSDYEGFDNKVMTEKKSKMLLIQSSNIPRQSIICESFDPSSIDNDTFEKNRKIFPKTAKQLDKIREIFKTIFLFNCLDEDQINKVIESMFLVEVYKGDIIIKENDPGDNFYVIDYGTFTASNESETILEKYHGEGFFGELALLYNCPRAATVVANADGGLWAIDRVTFRQLILKSAYQKRKRFLEFIKSVPILQELTEYDRFNLADALKTKVISNERIITEGETGDKMYFIEEGEVLITVRNEQMLEEEKKRLYAGDYFGDVALLAKIPRIASVYACGTTKLAELDVKSYNRLMGPCIDLMRNNFSKYKDQLEAILTKEQLKDLFKDAIQKETKPSI